MAELLNKSLDEIIKESRVERKGGAGRGGRGGRGRSNGNGRGKGGNNNAGAFKANRSSVKLVVRDNNNRQLIKKPFQNNDITSRLGGKESDFDKGRHYSCFNHYHRYHCYDRHPRIIF